MGSWLVWAIAGSIAMTIAYALMRILMAVVTQLRDGAFAKVAMHAVRRLALRTFEHMHRLSLRFHLERKTGGLTRVLERGRAGIEELSRLMVLTLVPTIVELVLVLGILAYEFDWLYSVVVATMIAAYLGFTWKATEWRIGIRRRMNNSDTEANTKAVDSLRSCACARHANSSPITPIQNLIAVGYQRKLATTTHVLQSPLCSHLSAPS